MTMKIKFILFLLLFSFLSETFSKESDFTLVRLKYNGGGDWYNDQSADVNIMKYVKNKTNINIKPDYTFVDLASDDLFKYPMIWLTGHGNVSFTKQEVINLKAYLENGGFLYIDDDYGLDPYIRKELKKVFPDDELMELPFSHPIYKSYFDFSQGVPKIHEHDNKSPQGFGIYINGRLAVYYTYESNLGDGWTDKNVHNDPDEVRENALKMGTNIIVYVLNN